MPPLTLADLSDDPWFSESAVDAMVCPVAGESISTPEKDPSMRTVEIVWTAATAPGVPDQYVTTRLSARYEPTWWPEDISFQGPKDDASLAKMARRNVALLRRETELFLSLTGIGILDGEMDSRFVFRNWEPGPDGRWGGFAREYDRDPQGDRSWAEMTLVRRHVPISQHSFYLGHLPTRFMSREDISVVRAAQEDWMLNSDHSEWWLAYPYSVASQVMEG